MEETSSSIKVSVPDSRERKRRQRELLLALAGIVLVVLFTWVELQYLGVNSYLFIGLFNINFVLMLVILFVVFRNVVKLILERRRKVLGSKLRTRLVLSFMTLSLVPTALMFLVGVKFVQTSVDYWFKGRVETSLEQALEVGQAFYSSSQERLQRRGGHLLDSIRERRFAWGGKGMDEFLELKRREYDLGLVGVITPERNQQNWHMIEGWGPVWQEAREKINWENLQQQEDAFWTTIQPGPAADIVFGVIPVDRGETGYLALGESIGHGLMYRLDKIARGIDEYKQLRTMKYPIKVAMYMTLGVVTLFIVFGAMWFGFRLAKELSAPVQALAAGTQRIAKGDLGVRLEDHSSDELGFLVKSFNSMAQDLDRNRKSLEEANLRLGRQNQELEERGRYIEALLDNMTAGVISLDSNGRVSTVNKAAEAMLGLDAGSLLGKRPLDLLAGEYSMLLKDVFEQLGHSPGAQWQRQIDLSLGSRDLKLLVNVVALKTSDGREAGLVAVFEDVTELEKMQRLAAWREVARRIAHEIKNPLTPIKLSAQRIERKFQSEVEDPVFKECTDLIVRQVEHLQQMVKEFSSFAKLPEVVLKPDYLAPLLEEVVADFRHTHSGIQWRLEVPTPIPQLKMDREGIRRVLINVLTNAAEALRGAEHGEVEVHASYDKLLGWVRLEVRDNGPGLSDEERSRLFEPYFSQKKGGTGLGLTIVRSIVSDHRGYVRAKPNQPRGSVIVVELPV